MAVAQLIQPLRTISPIRWQGRQAPQRDWLIEGVVLRKTVSLFSGRGGTGKTLLMQQLMTAAATGNRWLDREVPRCRTFAIFAEDPEDEIWRRQDDISRFYNVEHGDLEDMDMMSLDEIDSPALYRTTKAEANGAPTPLWFQIVNHIQDFGAQLVILDNAAALFEANENYKEHVRPFIGMLIKLARDINGAVILLQHPGKDGEADGSGLSGSRMWRNSVRSQMVLGYPKEANDDEEPTDERILKFAKANYGKKGAPLRIEWREGVFVPCTIAGQHGGSLSSFDLLELRGKIANAMRHGIQRGMRYSLNRQARNNVGAVLRQEREWQRYTAADIMNSCESMVIDGRLKLVSVGTSGRSVVLVRPSDAAYSGELPDDD